MAEIYDPTTGLWSQAGELDRPTVAHTATLLPDGRLLVAGGTFEYNGAGLAVAALYDPVTNSWSDAANLTTARAYHAAALLADGSVLVSGGQNTEGVTATAERYDPVANLWLPAADMRRARSWHTLTLLPDGQLLAAGGYDPGNVAERYDPVGNDWTFTGGRFLPFVNWLSAVALDDGRVMVTDETKGAIYDPATETWLNVYPPGNHRAHATVRTGDGRVLLSGGYDFFQPPEYYPFLDRTVVYDPATNEWDGVRPMIMPRARHTLTLLADGRVLVVGGEYFEDLDSAELFSPRYIPPPVLDTFAYFPAAMRE